MAKRKKTSFDKEEVGVFAIDAGGTSGCFKFQGRIEGSLKEIAANGKWETWQVDCMDREEIIDGHPSFMFRAGALEICAAYEDAAADWILAGIPYTHHFFIFEDFVLRGAVSSTDRVGLSPLAINHYCFGFLADQRINWVPQTPEQAKTRMSNDRLRSAGMWIKGMGTDRGKHAADATRHFGLWVAKQR